MCTDVHGFASQIIPDLSNKCLGLSKVGRPPLRLHPGDVAIKDWTIPGKIEAQTVYPNHSKKGCGRNTAFIYIYIYQRLSKCLCVWIINILYILYILDIMLVYTCRDVCVWFELHCTYTFSPAKGCLELVDSGQAPWHLAYCCGEIVLLAKFGAMNLIESAS